MKNQHQNVLGIDVDILLPILRKFPYLRLVVGIVFGLGISYGLASAVFLNQGESQSFTIVQSQNFTRAEYERLQIGMQLVEVEAILDRGIEVQQSVNIKTFVWRNFNGSTITATFKNGKLTNKQQAQL
jgi:hypothetical protein